MPLAIPKHQPKTAEQLVLIADCGFSFCNKDQRYECKRKLSEEKLDELKEAGFTVTSYGKGIK